MKATLKVPTLVLVLSLTPVAPLFAQSSTAQQEPAQQQQEKEKRGGLLGKIFGQGAKTNQEKQDKQEKGTSSAQKSSSQGNERLEPDDTNALPADVPAEIQAGRRAQLSEDEAAVVPYYNNFLTTYRLGPEDVISVSIFNQDRYSKSGITVPPTGKISYPLIPEGIVVVGKTTEQVQEEIRKRLDEYIIDPQVTVSLDKAVSATYSVVGDVAQPGVRTMTRRYSITEALAMAGGVLNTGDKAKVVILRQQADGNVHPIFVNVKNIERGRAKEMAFLVPGDQVVVPGNRLKKWKAVMDLLPVLSFARIFAGGF
jgi:polysaccharide export outer membrane protein